jgi:hypothetical protein
MYTVARDNDVPVFVVQNTILKHLVGLVLGLVCVVVRGERTSAADQMGREWESVGESGRKIWERS